ncbi:FecR family protein [Chitinophaga skermanii]|uniref:FecR family protein n=1 Tax=Chitinophaga skermanii TaxID=331697 RepID=A0A327QHF0_9BACT|nr:FecR domain-containing protein [Chitinophaga skermanii]RAJ04036.1 FecR family protein [Chitinophaga skermanii]
MEAPKFDDAYIQQLFAKLAAGTITEQEQSELDEYLANHEAPGLLPSVDDLLAQQGETGWEQMAPADANRVYEHILASRPTEAAQVSTVRRMAAYKWYYTAAAVALLLVLGGAYLWKTPRAEYMTVATGYGEIKKITLPDGSSVTLNANATLRFASNMQSLSSREAWITGEGYFNVAQSAQKSFVVHAKALTVEVLGTTFNVKAQNLHTSVVLNSGKVKVASKRESTILQPGEMVLYDHAALQFKHQAADTTTLTSWKNNQLIFKDTPLREVAAIMQQQFGVAVRFDHTQLAQTTFTGTLPATELEVAMTILEQSLDIQIDQTNKQVLVIKAK